jgi:hypothetical protein
MAWAKRDQQVRTVPPAPVRDYAVTVTIETSFPVALPRLLEVLQPLRLAAAVTAGPDRVIAVMMIQARDPVDAHARASRVVLGAVAGQAPDETGVCEVIGVELLTAGERARLSTSEVPPLARTMEAAALLGVPPAHVSELLEQDGFPQPVQVLPSGPIWTVDSLQRYVAARRDDERLWLL